MAHPTAPGTPPPGPPNGTAPPAGGTPPVAGAQQPARAPLPSLDVAALNAGGASQGRFGTFAGVFTPVVLTILGVIMFMRVGYVSGYAGLWMTLVILGLSKVITVLTTLSLSAIATNLDVRVGGVYFMISRVLGPDFGGSIGITLFIAQAVSVAFYTIGFTEATFGVLAALLGSESMAAAAALHLPQIVSTVVVAGLFALTFKGADVALKAQYVVLAVLLLSVVSFLVGGALAFDPERFVDNQPSAFTSEIGFWTAFAIFFPAATGISAGANMSGDLKDPGKSIPWGTLLAIIFTLAVYAAQIVLTAGATPRDELQSDPFGALQRMSVFGPLVVAGVFAATLSSALGSFLGAPRVLQAMGQDRLMKPLVFFGKGAGPQNEPRRATVLTFIIAVGVIWAGDLNAVAEIISMFFLIAYGMINLSAFVESKSANPSFRPRFRLFHWSTGLVGAIGCVVAMLKINDSYALAAFAITALLYFYLRKRDIQTSWGDAKRGYIFQRTRDSLLYLEGSKFHPKNWRPILAALSRDPLTEPGLIQVGSWLESRRGLYTVGEVSELPGSALTERLTYRDRRLAELRQSLRARDIIALSEVLVVDRFDEGFASFLQCYSVGGLRPNTVLLSVPPPEQVDRRARLATAVQMLHAFRRNVVLLKPGDIVLRKPRRVIDLWWRGAENGSLMALLAYLMTLDRTWQGSTIRIFRAVPDQAAEAEARRSLEALIEQARIQAEIHVFPTGDHPHAFILQRSAPVADLVMLGLSEPVLDGLADHLASLQPLLQGLPTTLLVWSNGDADLFA
ncbi:MAG: amino acid permease [Deltaproteobacteria bacterium]|jgi:amino acid transporter|nr:amino acid permease [Deltaproteobacteria bacterium]MBW2530690.1 amino acid permease [Deltaproteobacteria bacterium]